MTTNALSYTVFQRVLFPEIKETEEVRAFSLRRSYRFLPPSHLVLAQVPIVIFDFETTGLDADVDRIIEVGARKMLGTECLGEYAFLVDVPFELSPLVTKLTGITKEMLSGQPDIETVLRGFLKFIEGSILFAHNAAFDSEFLQKECLRLNMDIEWPTFCTLKMARELLPDLESRSLDALAAHYGLSFEARHRSIGDVRVTADVLSRFFQRDPVRFQTIKSLEPFGVI